jgi:mevalonate kinase
VAHGGRASGIDAKTVSFGKPLIFQRSFSPEKFEGTPADFTLPSRCCLLLVDTNVGKKEGTKKMLEIFASQFGIAGTPAEAPEEKRKAVREEFAHLWEQIVASMKKPGASELGGLMGENHALLRARKMSSVGIEKAVSSALSCGALGAKLTGGGGEGGAVLALCKKADAGKVAKGILEETGFPCHTLGIAKKGACVD